VTHIGLSSRRIRARLVDTIGANGHQGLYALVALGIFVPLVWVYFANKHAGTSLWEIPRSPVFLWAIYAGMAVAFVMLTAAVVRPSPASLAPGGDTTPRGIYRITRHPLVMGLVIFGALHLLANGKAPDVAFFGGFIGFGLLGAWHQDRRKLAAADEKLRGFYAGTPFLPFTGRETARGLRELSPLVIVLGIGLTVVVRYFHKSWFS
jgi:uncharacterized membrane protein